MPSVLTRSAHRCFPWNVGSISIRAYDTGGLHVTVFGPRISIGQPRNGFRVARYEGAQQLIDWVRSLRNDRPLVGGESAECRIN